MSEENRASYWQQLYEHECECHRNERRGAHRLAAILFCLILIAWWAGNRNCGQAVDLDLSYERYGAPHDQSFSSAAAVVENAV